MMEVVVAAATTPLEELSTGADWDLCAALLTLHAIADEACAGLGVALAASNPLGCGYRGRARELLAQRGTLARISQDAVLVLPKVRTPAAPGTSIRSMSRYATAHGPSVGVRWHKLPARRRGTEPRADHVNFLLLPWPLQIRASDFRPSKVPRSAIPTNRMDSSTSTPPSDSTWIWWTGCWSPPATRSTASTWCACRRARSRRMSLRRWRHYWSRTV
jgi:hypothetical protein